MTEEPSIAQEPDAIPLRRHLLTAALAFVVAALGVFAARQLLHHARRGERSLLHAPLAGLEHSSIAQTERGIERETAQKKRLSSYGWVDRNAGLAHIPIERAIELRAKGQR
ncbi:MAG TPA: hypothetical protein VHV51_00890 [Polyangiaceae bacterium]|jgi:hypothetical protein|nr:hypothetical protein [Polyangiaceae bacterium]